MIHKFYHSLIHLVNSITQFINILRVRMVKEMSKPKGADLSNRTEFAITDMESLCRKSIDLIHYARNLAVQQINLIELMTNYTLGYWIVEEQQNGQDRA